MREAIIHKRASFLRDAVFAASDGLVTTFAVVAGAQGATLGPDVVLILGFANLFADGISMSSGAYLGVKSEMEFEKAEGDKHFSGASPIKQAFVTFFAFDIAGLLPLLPFLFRVRETFLVSSFLVAILLFLVGIIVGSLGALYFLFVQFFILKVICSTCIIVDVWMLLISFFVFSEWRRKRR